MKGFFMAAAGLLAASALVGGAILFFSADRVASGSQGDIRLAASVAMHAISFNQEINDRLGPPLQMGKHAVQRDDNPLIGPRSLTLSLEVTGSKGTGKATVNMARASSRDSWVVKNGNLFPSNGPPIFIRSTAPTGER